MEYILTLRLRHKNPTSLERRRSEICALLKIEENFEIENAKKTVHSLPVIKLGLVREL